FILRCSLVIEGESIKQFTDQRRGLWVRDPGGTPTSTHLPVGIPVFLGRLFLHWWCLIRQRDLVELINDNGGVAAPQIGPVVFVEPGGLLEIFFAHIEDDGFLILSQLKSFPRNREVLVAEAKKSTEIQNDVLDVAVAGIDDKIFDVPKFLALRALNSLSNQITRLEHSALVACFRRIYSDGDQERGDNKADSYFSHGALLKVVF